MPQLGAEDLGDALQHRVAGEVAVGVVDLAQQVEVGHDQRHRPLEALGAPELLRQRRREVARVEEAGLGVDARLGLQLRHRQSPVDQQQRGDRERDEPRVARPEGGEHDSERREDELRREGLVREELAHRVPVDPADHGRDQRRVERDERDRGRRAGEREANLVARDQAVRAAHQVSAAPHADIVAIVKTRMLKDWTYQVPRLRSHSGTCWISGSTASERRRQQQHGRDQEDAGRVVALVARRAHDEELRERDADREDRELEPVARRLIELREERGRDGDRDRGDDEEVRERLRRQLAARIRRPCSRARSRLREESRSSSACALHAAFSLSRRNRPRS